MLQGRGRATYKGETSEVNELKLTTDVCESERPEIVKRARLIFDQFYGVPRRSGKDNREHRVGEGAPSSGRPKDHRPGPGHPLKLIFHHDIFYFPACNFRTF